MKKHKSFQSFSAIHTMNEDNESENHGSFGKDYGLLKKSQQTTPTRWLEKHRRVKSMSPMLEKKNHSGYMTLDEEEDEWSGIDGSFASALAFKNNAFSPTNIRKSKALGHIEQFQLPQKAEKIKGSKKINGNSCGSDSEGTVSTKLCNSQSDSLLSFNGSDVQQKVSSKSSGSLLSLTESDEHHKSQCFDTSGDLMHPSGSDIDQKELSKRVMTKPKSKTFDDIVGMITTSPSPRRGTEKIVERPLKHIVATPSEEDRMHTLLNDNPVHNSTSYDRQIWWEDDENGRKKHSSSQQGFGKFFMDVINSILDGCQTLGLCTDDDDKFRIGGEIHINPDEQSHVFDDITFDQSFARQRRWRADI